MVRLPSLRHTSTGLLVLLLCLARPAWAQVEAHFRVYSINGGCVMGSGDGDPERYPSMGVFDSTSVFNSCTQGCSDDGNAALLNGETTQYCTYSSGCGFWDFPNQYIEKLIPNNSGAYFYFGLWDVDDDILFVTNADDSLGDHWWSYRTSPVSGTVWNNNASPYYADHPISRVCGSDVEDIGIANNYTLTYDIWFEDQSAPNSPGNPTIWDDGLSVYWENDTTLDWTWSLASDPHTGIAAYHTSLWRDGSGFVFVDQSAPAGSDTVCPGGCGHTYTPVHGVSYQVIVRALNGSTPVLDNQSANWSAWIPFAVDLVSPTSTVTAPSSAAWQGANQTTFNPSMNDSDSGSGLASCDYRVISSGVTTRSFSSRTCNSSVALSVGPTALCRHQGTDTCRLTVRSFDAARRSTSTDAFFDIDWTADAVTITNAKTSSSGADIPEASWTSDRDPWFSWSTGTPISPIANFHWALNADPACGGANQLPAATTSLQLGVNSFSESATPNTFRIRPVDAAGNCGNVTSRQVRVDYTPDATTNVQQLTALNGDVIPAGEWTNDNTPYMSWDAALSSAPITGYSVSTSGVPDCETLEVFAPARGIQLSALTDGTTTFRVRAVDAANNCGAVTAYTIRVDTSGDPMVNLRAFAEAGGAEIFSGVSQSDNDPLMSWQASTSLSGIKGYSYALDAVPVCPPHNLTGTEVTLPGLTDGSHVFRVRALDNAGNCGPTSTFTIVVDTQGAPIASLQAFDGSNATITAGSWQRETDPRFVWTTDDPGVVGYAYGTGPSIPCEEMTDSTTVTLDDLAQGQHTFRVRTIDAALNCGPVATFAVWVDSVGDNLTSLSAVQTPLASPPVSLVSGGWQRDATPRLSWTANVSGGTARSDITGYSYALNADPDCTVETAASQVDLAALPQGQTSFRIVAHDAAGNCGAVSTFTLAVDTVQDSVTGLAAQTQRTGGVTIPASTWTSDTTPFVTWTASTSTAPISGAPLAGYSWSVTGVPDCTGAAPAETDLTEAEPTLADGQRSFQVRAIDQAGNCGPVAELPIWVDTAGDPVTGVAAFTQQPPGATAIFDNTWQSDDSPWLTWDLPAAGTNVVGYNYNTGGPGTGDPACTTTLATPGVSLAGLGDGVTWFRVRARDAAGNCGASAVFRIALDRTGDGIATLTARRSGGGAVIPSGAWTNETNPEMSWTTGATTHAPIVGFSTAIDGMPTCADAAPATSLTAGPLAEGSHTFRVSAIDAAGNCGTPASYTLNVDVTGDNIVNLRAETATGAVPVADGDWQQDPNLRMRWDASTSTAPIAGYSYTADGTSPDCASVEATTLSALLNNVSEGVTPFSIRAIDQAGNCGSVSIIQLAVDHTNDAIATLEAYTEEGGVPIANGAWQRDVDPFLIWTPGEAEAPIVGYSYSTSGVPDCTAETTDTQLVLDPLAEGSTVFRLSAVDAADNCGVVRSFTIAVDTVGDSVGSLQARNDANAVIPAGSWTSDSTPRITWSASGSTSPDLRYSYSLSGAPDCDLGISTREVTVGPLSNGLTTFQIAVVDTAGNCGPPSTLDLRVDATSDSIANLRALTGPAGAPIGNGAPQQDTSPLLLWDVPASVSDIEGYSYAINEAADCSVDTTTTEVALSGLAEGSHVFAVRAIDDANNCGPPATFTVVVDTSADTVAGLRAQSLTGQPILHAVWQRDTAPVLLWDPSFAPASGAGYSWSTTGEPDCDVDTTSTQVALAGLGQGLTTFSVRARDAAGNCGTTVSLTIAVDTVNDSIAGLTAVDPTSGATIGNGGWSRITAPIMRWSDSPSVSPIIGYSYAIDEAPDCTPNSAELEHALAGLGQGLTTFNLRPLDAAGNCGVVQSYLLRVDTATDAVGIIQAFSERSGSVLPATTWQADNTPFFDWADSVSTAPIAGYSTSLTGMPDCEVDAVPSELAPGAVAENVVALQVRAVDAAGNCGASSAFVLWVDSQPDALSKVSAFSNPGDVGLVDAVWHPHTSVRMTWETHVSTSPIVGYAYGTGAVVDCTQDTILAETIMNGLSQGETVFWARARDAAGNCGAPGTFRLWVDNVPESLTNLRALTDAVGGTTIFDGVWQRDRDPLMRWDPPSSTAPLAGYSFSTAGDPDCTANTAETRAALVLSDGRTTFRVRAVDAAGNCGSVEDFELAVDGAAESVSDLHALTGPGGTPVVAAVWQPDRTPLLLWTAPASVSPVDGYSWGIGDAPDCVVETDGTSVAPPGLTDGRSDFWVRVVDEAGNCGPATTFDLAIDGAPDPIANLRALTEAGGSPISEGVPQRDTDPLLLWDASTSVSPIAGYSTSIGTPADCTVDTTATELALIDLADGDHVFRLRAIDDANNCGPEDTFEIRVDTTADGIANLRAERAVGGVSIAHAVWQQADDVVLRWDPSFAPGPGAGYSYTVFRPGDEPPAAVPDCESVDVTTPSVPLFDLPDGLTTFTVLAIDQVGNCGLPASITIAVDDSNDTMVGLTAVDPASGATIANGAWSAVAAPLMRWDASASTAPIAGYSTATDADPDCTVETTGLQQALAGLPQNLTTFHIRPIDAAGNCGLVSSYQLRVDTAADAITDLGAHTAAGGAVIPAATWQVDNTPYFDWDANTSVAPISGYSVSLSEEPDCAVDVGTSHTSPGLLAEGVTTFRVRAIDGAGNCGASAAFTIWVDSQADPLTGLAAFAIPSGAAIADSTWQNANMVRLTWTAAPSTAPLDGFDWGLGSVDPTCTRNGVDAEATIGPLVEGQTNTFWVRARDAAGNCGAALSVQIWVDTVADELTNLTAHTSATGGTQLTAGAWQRDGDLYMDWNAAPSTAPIAGYSWSTAGDPDCVPETTETNADLLLSDGRATFRVRPVDAAGNCGAVEPFELAVDRTPEIVTDLFALTGAAGELIEADTWQSDRTPLFQWTAPTSTSPIDGYSWGTAATTDCVVDTDATSVAPTAFADGRTTFWVRTVDEAGNCGERVDFVVAVDATPDPMGALRVLTEAGGTSVPARRWQSDNDPHVEWDVPASTAPIAAYALAIDGEPNCAAADLIEPAYAFGDDALTDGVHTIQVLARDEAGNCGTASTFEVWVLAAAPVVTVQPVSPDPARAGVLLNIRVSVDRELAQPPTVEVEGGGEGEFLSFVAGVYSYRYLVTGTEPEGAVAVIATATDLAGNTGSGEGVVTFDFTRAGLLADMEIAPGIATTDDVLAIAFESDESLSAAPAVVVADDNPAALVLADGNRYSYGYVVTGAEGEGAVEVAAELVDRAGNPATVVETFVLDLTAPVVRVTYPDRRLVLDIGQSIEITWETTELHPATVSIDLSRDGGTSFPERIAMDIPDTGSFTWTVAGAEANLARFRVVARDVVGLEGSDVSDYDVRLRTPVADHVLAVAERATSPVGTAVPVLLTVVDRQGDPVPGVFEVTVTTSGSARIADTTLVGATAGGASATGTTAADGTASVSVFDLVAEPVSVAPAAALPVAIGHIPASVRFLPLAGDHIVIAVDDGIADVDEEEVLTVFAVDSEGNPSPSDVEVRVTASGRAVFAGTSLLSAVGVGTNEIYGRLGEDGMALIRLVDEVTELVEIAGHSDSLTNGFPDEPAQVQFVQTSGLDPLQITVEASPPRVYADGIAYSLITVTPRETDGAIAGAGLEVEVLVQRGDLGAVEDMGDGTYTAELRSDACFEDPVVIGARVEDVLVQEGAEVQFTCDELGDADFWSEPETIVADGETCADVFLVLWDPDGEAMPAGQFVEFAASYGELGEVTFDGTRYAAELCAEVCGEDGIEVRGFVNGVPLTDIDSGLRLEVGVECLGVDPEQSTIVANPVSLPADGVTATTVTVTPVRLDGQGLGPGLVVEIASPIGMLTAVTDEGDGTYTARLVSEEVGEAVITARVAGVPLLAEERVTFLEFVPPLDWVRLEASLAEGEDAVAWLNVINQAGRDLTDMAVLVTTSGGVDLQADGTTWNGEPVTVSYDGGAGAWIVELGTLSSTSGPTPPRVQVRYRIDGDAPEGTATLTFQAHRRERPVSEVATLVLAVNLGEVTVEACSCASSGGFGWEGGLTIGGLLLVALNARRRRR